MKFVNESDEYIEHLLTADEISTINSENEIDDIPCINDEEIEFDETFDELIDDIDIDGYHLSRFYDPDKGNGWYVTEDGDFVCELFTDETDEEELLLLIEDEIDYNVYLTHTHM